jgi:hypothetical protein
MLTYKLNEEELTSKVISELLTTVYYYILVYAQITCRKVFSYSYS